MKFHHPEGFLNAEISGLCIVGKWILHPGSRKTIYCNGASEKTIVFFSIGIHNIHHQQFPQGRQSGASGPFGYVKGLLGFTKTEKPERGDESLGDASQQPQDGVDRDVSQGKGADRAHSPVGSLASNVIPPVRTVGIVPLTAEGYIDIDDTYLIPPHMEGRPRLMRASAKLELASDQKGKDFGVPSVREFSTLLYGLVLSERDSVQRFQKVEASMQKISKVGDEKMKASLLALLYRRANNYYFDGL